MHASLTDNNYLVIQTSYKINNNSKISFHECTFCSQREFIICLQEFQRFFITLYVLCRLHVGRQRKESN